MRTKTFKNDYKELAFEVAKGATYIKDQLTTFKFYRKVITLRIFLNRMLRVPKRIEVVRIPDRYQDLGDLEQEFTNRRIWRKFLCQSIVTETRVFKNKSIITVKTDVQSRYLRPI